VVAALHAASLDPSDVYLTGVDLARVMAEHGGQPDLEDVDTQVRMRAETDGTLFSAMCAATWTTGGPADLDTPQPVDVEPRWQAPLARVRHPGLRAHLGELCSNEVGIRYVGDDHCPAPLNWLARQPGYTLVTGWDADPSDFSSAVLAIHPGSESLVAAPHPGPLDW